MDYKSVFTNLCLELQQNRSWIKGLGKNPQKSELIHWRQCLLSRGTEACSLGLRETPACIHVIQRLSQPRVACWHGFRQNSQKTECVFTRCPTGGKKKLRVYTASEAKGLRDTCIQGYYGFIAKKIKNYDAQVRGDVYRDQKPESFLPQDENYSCFFLQCKSLKLFTSLEMFQIRQYECSFSLRNYLWHFQRWFGKHISSKIKFENSVSLKLCQQKNRDIFGEIPLHQGCDLTKVKKSWNTDSRPGSPFRGQSPLNFLDV